MIGRDRSCGLIAPRTPARSDADIKATHAHRSAYLDLSQNAVDTCSHITATRVAGATSSVVMVL